MVTNVLGVKIKGHDTGAAIVSNGRVFAVSEERLNRIKHSKHIFPHLSIDACIEMAGLKPDDINLIVIDQYHDREVFDMENIFKSAVKQEFKNAQIKVINHHLAHASSAFLCSPFEEAAIMIIDSTGEEIHTHFGPAFETNSLYYGNNNKIHLIRKTFKSSEAIGIGKLYSLITRRFLNLGRHNEGKTMGLASYGNAEKIFKDIPKNKWYKEADGHFLCNPFIGFQQPKDKFLKKYGNIREIKRIAKNIIKKILEKITPDKVPKRKKFFEEIRLDYPARKNEKLPIEYYNNVAAAVQAVLEEIFLKMSRQLYEITRSKNLCLAGGCALNGVSNNKILEDGKFKDIFIQPACSDAGIPLGCALYGYHIILKQPRFWMMKTAYLGKEYAEEDYEKALENYKKDIDFHKSTNIAKETAELIKDGKIVGWFQGRSEYGPRALGSRSILCDPRIKEMKDILNERVKHRENWRPFAASVLLEKMPEYFHLNYESPFMLLVPKVKEKKKKLIPSIAHIDGTCRIQSVTKKDNGLYYDLIKEFDKLTGMPMVLNTSFNLAGDPIVETPEDALKCFLKTQMDRLIIGNYVVSKKFAKNNI